MSTATSVEVTGRLASTGTLQVGLWGLCQGGVQVTGGLAQLSALRPIEVPWTTPALYADPHLAVHASLAHDALPVAGGQTQVVVEVEGLAPPAVRPPLRVHLVIDASQSMRGGWGDVLDAANAVVARLRPQDELQIVVYGTDATEALAPMPIGNGAHARQVIANLHFGGRTNIEAGLRLAYGRVQTGGRSLVILVSDGVPQGGLSMPDELGALAAEANARAGAITLSVGLGTEFHTGVLSTLAAEGGGDFRIAPRSSELRVLLETEIEARGGIVATDLVTNVEAAQGVTFQGESSFRLGAVAAGETRTFVVPATVSHTGNIAHVSLRFSDASGRPIVVEGALDLASAPQAMAVGAMTATLDASLADALVVCGHAIENGDGGAASAALQTYVTEVQGVLTSRPDMPAAAALRARNEAALRIAGTLPGLVAEASWGERRRTGAAFAEWSFSLR
jgi:Mg-chelatase subunit ChlD/NAD(P)H-hydrate repair Nnr-like enzyme with NAD(P)H-hydrate epimerase domain